MGVRASKKSSSRETAHIGARILLLRLLSVPAGLRASGPQKVIGAVKQAATTAMHGAMGGTQIDQTSTGWEKQTSLVRRATLPGAHWPREGPLPLALAPIVDPAHRIPRKMRVASLFSSTSSRATLWTERRLCSVSLFWRSPYLAYARLITHPLRPHDQLGTLWLPRCLA